MSEVTIGSCVRINDKTSLNGTTGKVIDTYVSYVVEINCGQHVVRSSVWLTIVPDSDCSESESAS